MVIDGSAESTETVYAVRLGSVFSLTICGRSRWDARWEGSGVQTRPLVCLIMKAICSVEISSAAMTRSPSFSRSVESRTTTNSPSPVHGMISSEGNLEMRIQTH